MRRYGIRFRVQIYLRVLLLAVSVFIFSYFLLPSTLYATMSVFGMIILYEIYGLIRFIEKANQQVCDYLLSIKYEDVSLKFKGERMGPPFDEVAATFEMVMDKVREIRFEKQEHYRYLQTVIHHIGMGLLAFRPDGGVDLINRAAERLLQAPGLRNINLLKDFFPELVEALFAIGHGEKKLVGVKEVEMTLSLYASNFVSGGEAVTLVSLQDIHSELEDREIEAWQQLIRVLTHEIMNSMTPISSMAETILDVLPLRVEEKRGKINSDDAYIGENTGNRGDASNGDTREHVASAAGAPGAENRANEWVPAAGFLDYEMSADIREALETIRKRSLGLTEFVNAYRDLTLIPKPTFKLVSMEELLGRVGTLLQRKFEDKGILFDWRVEPRSLELTADPTLVEQVLINLVLNAVDAVEGVGEPGIGVTASLDRIGRVVLRVKDNGRGIVEEALQKVFIPFYTTKKKGSGIGLSLSRQIMKLHKGSIDVISIPGKETTFILRF